MNADKSFKARHIIILVAVQGIFQEKTAEYIFITKDHECGKNTDQPPKLIHI